MIIKCDRHSIHYNSSNGCPNCRHDPISKDNIFKSSWDTSYWYEGSSVHKYYNSKEFKAQRLVNKETLVQNNNFKNEIDKFEKKFLECDDKNVDFLVNLINSYNLKDKNNLLLVRSCVLRLYESYKAGCKMLAHSRQMLMTNNNISKYHVKCTSPVNSLDLTLLEIKLMVFGICLIFWVAAIYHIFEIM